MNQALIGNISRYALHDGPGIRTTVFFKGCAMDCPWCHNPELVSERPEILWSPQRCIHCGDCLDVCPERAITHIGEEKIHREGCTGCGFCCEACPAKALELAGTLYTLEELVEILLRDRNYYESSGGGVTLSGGEPTQRLPFISQLAQTLASEGIHTVLETNGLFPWKAFKESCLDHLDLVFFDIKIGDPREHLNITGKSNDTILMNLARLAADRPQDVVARIPLIPGFTATEENIGELATLIETFGVRFYSLLPYHPYGIAKAEKIGRRTCSALPKKSMNRSEIAKWRSFFNGLQFVET